MFDPFLLRATIWLSVFAWAGAELLRGSSAGRRALARGLWSAGALCLAIHTALAFQFRHGWSHTHAYDTTAQQAAALTGVAAGEGLYLNYALLIVWIADAAWWWRDARGYERRHRAIEWPIFAFFFFMMVNGAVIFASSPMRWAGALAVALVLIARVSGGAPRTAEG